MQNDQYKEVLTVIIAGILIFFVLTGVVVFILLFYQKKRFQHQQLITEMASEFQEQLLKSRIETQEHSFNEISRELHDNIGQLLSSTKMLLGVSMLEQKAPSNTLKIAEETVGKAIADLRALSKSLNADWLHQFDLVENLLHETSRINTINQTEVRLISQYKKLPLEVPAQIMLFRVVQEALQNCIKHAAATNISIQIKDLDNFFELAIEDNGKGFNINSIEKNGIGLKNMQHRTALLGGTIIWKPVYETGTAVIIKIPAKHKF